MAKDLQRDVVLRAVHASLRGLVRPGAKILAAVSGGADSLALALALSEIAPQLGFTVAIGTVDHALRRSSRAEAARVQAWAKAHGLECASKRVTVAREGGLEAAARMARYQALERMADELGADWISTAHTASDQAETVLLRLARGSGLRGARGVLPVRGRIVRPMLALTRGDVERFLKHRRERPLVEDPSNRDLDRARNRIRHRVLPELRRALPGADAALARFARLARDDEAALEAWARSLPEDRDPLRAAPVAVLRRWIRYKSEALDYTPNATELIAAARAIRSERSGELELGRRITVRFGARVSVSVVAARERATESVLMPGAARDLEWAGLAFRVSRASKRPRGLLEIDLPASVALPFTVRAVRPGDRMAGERGTIRLKRLLVDRKVPRHERSRVPVLVDAHGELLWVVGHRVSAKVHLAAGAKAAWRISARPL